MEWTQRCSWRLKSSGFRDAVGGHDRARLDEYLDVVDRRRARVP